METLRLIKKPVNSTITITLPESFGDGEMEVIVRPVENSEEDKKDIDITKYRGIWKDKDLDIDKICRELREEWERDF